MLDSIFQYSLISLLLLIGYLIIKYPNRAIGTRARPDLKGPKGFPIVGNLFLILLEAERFNDTTLELTKKYGEIYTYTLPGVGRFIAINTPELIEHILKTNYLNYPKGPYFYRLLVDAFGDGIFNVDGESWIFQRKIINKIIQGKNFRTIIYREFEVHSKIMLGILSEAAETGESIDLQSLFYRFTFDVFTKICFNQNSHTLTNPENVPLFAVAFDYCQAVIKERFLNPLWPILEIFSESGRKNRKYCKVLDDYSYNIIQERRREPLMTENSTDILHLFMGNGEHLNDKELRDAILNVMIAGRDTTAVALSWMMYRIMTNPSVEKNLLKEFDSLITPENPIPDYDSIKKLTYAYATWTETLRLHPSVPINFKTAVKDDILPGGVPVNAGDMLLWSPYAMGRDERVWGNDVNEFKPERFLKLGELGEYELIKPSSFKFIAFNAGPRICVGQEFATIEALFLLAVMLKNYRFELLTNEKMITYATSILLPMKNPLLVKVTKREA
ncbi:4886_t:CDS:2, partial [Ambispora leptoticha]